MWRKLYNGIVNEKGEQLSEIGEGKELDFYANISMIAVNENYVSVVADGKCHFINLQTEKTEKVFPLKNLEDNIIYVAMTENFLAYSDSNNRVKIYTCIFVKFIYNIFF